ncbi:lantibiotic dehydratase [Nocardiopsis sp. RSe5-2]|uniref:Lantibiotic dehydratase n=1 Tax=Nocardiopsis endophytica TaxID=3018445 RepID=A0ABT4U354_9ACTN|nr:lantibiotic dehydratase [Nocardiopsis endophytica]MDA2810875.1 lantibiotic dehydratase [Nocardiopsis endophytica]
MAEAGYHVCAVMLRATTADRATAPPGGADPDDSEGRRRLLGWSRELWGAPGAGEALRIASPVLHQRLSKVHARSDGANLGRREVKALVSSAAFALRWQNRPTPAGLFAGIAPASIGDTRVYWGGVHGASLRPDTAWLAAAIERLLAIDEVRRRAPVQANPCVHRRGDRLVAPGPASGGQSVLAAPVEVSVRRSAPALAALEAARSRVGYAELAEHLQQRFPGTTDSAITGFLGGLLSQGLLLEGLWAPMDRTDALAYLCEELHAIKAEEIPEAADLVEGLEVLAAQVSEDRPRPVGADRAEVAAFSRRMSRCHEGPGAGLTADVALDCDIALPRPVAEEARRAAELLVRLSPYPFGAQHWHEYHQRFRDRYGPGAAVPVLELVGDGGLGYPAGFLGSARQAPPRPRRPRDGVLLELVQRALMRGDNEVDLDERTVESLEADEEAAPPGRVELSAVVHARTLHALEEGDFLLEVTGAPRAASSMAGRFLHLLPEPEQERWARSYEADDGALTAQVAFVPRRRGNADIARTRQVLPARIALDRHDAREQAIAPDDLLVVGDARGFALIQASTGRAVEPRVLHALEAGTHTPPLARFIAELPFARCAAYTAFDPGAADSLPYLPRFRSGRTILAPARWRLRSSDLPGPSAPATDWDQAFQRWRDSLAVPGRVVMVEHDQRLPIDLDEPLHRRLLRSALEATGTVELRERPGEEGDEGWIGRAHEVLFALKTTRTPLRPAVAVSALRAHPVGEGPFVQARLLVHPDRADEVLTDHASGFFTQAPESGLWWFQREAPLAGGEPALMVTVRLDDPADHAALAQRLGAWAHALHTRHLSAGLEFTGHREHTGRFGHGDAMRAAHKVFAADSRAALAQITTARDDASLKRALAAASMVGIAEALAASPEQGRKWLADDLADLRAPVDRDDREHARRLLTVPPSTETELGRAWEQRRLALTDYRDRLLAQRDPRMVLRSLLHLHHRRALGPDHEESLLRLARDCAHSLLRQGQGRR